MRVRTATIKELSAFSSCFLDVYDERIIINGLNLCNRDSIHKSVISYITTPKYIPIALNNKAVKALFVSKPIYEKLKAEVGWSSHIKALFISDDPEVDFYTFHQALWDKSEFYDHFDFSPIIGKGCKIHPSAIIENGVIIGDNVTIGPNSVIRSGSIIDNKVIIGCCSVIGSEGFQGIQGLYRPVKHVGKSHLCDEVFIGDNSTVGNALFEGETFLGRRTWLDNHVHFAHNCKSGEGCIITACSLLMGSTTLEDNVWMAPNSVTLNKVTVHAGGLVGTLSFANKDVEANTIVAGIPAKPLRKK